MPSLRNIILSVATASIITGCSGTANAPRGQCEASISTIIRAFNSKVKENPGQVHGQVFSPNCSADYENQVIEEVNRRLIKEGYQLKWHSGINDGYRVYLYERTPIDGLGSSYTMPVLPT